MRNLTMYVIYVEGHATSPLFFAEASLCPREAGEREKESGGERWRKSLNNNDRDQDLGARETGHPTQTLVFTKTAGRQPG